MTSDCGQWTGNCGLNHMPIYEYEDRVTGERIEMLKPVNERYNCPPNLMPVISLPGRPRIGAGVPDPSHADQAIPRAFKECEQQFGTSETCRQAGFTAKQIRKAWKF
jgi:hypothetical protein